jgi:uncharacterized protein YdeI (YjbR/CyaY-like superfamily)
MPSRDPRVDEYIGKAAAFAQPILNHLREIAHKACPQIQETMKWSRPHFEYNGLVFGMSAFKQHCALHFRFGSELFGNNDTAMGQFGRITSLKDLPGKRELTSYIRKVVALNNAGVKPVRAKAVAPLPLVVPDDFAAALAADARATKAFDAFSPSNRREYVEWILEAKAAATREKRIRTSLEWLADGKTRNWRYTKKPHS